MQDEQLAAGLARVEAGLLQRDADLAASAVRVARDVDAGDLGAAGGDRQQRREHAHGRRLAGPVGPEEAEDLAGGDLEVDAADGLDRALAARVVLHKPFGQDGRAGCLVHLGSCRLAGWRTTDRADTQNSSQRSLAVHIVVAPLRLS